MVESGKGWVWRENWLYSFFVKLEFEEIEAIGGLLSFVCLGVRFIAFLYWELNP